MNIKAIKTLALITLNTSVVLFFWFYFQPFSFLLALLLLVILDLVLFADLAKSNQLIAKTLRMQYFKTKFKILNNADKKKGIKKTVSLKMSEIWLKIIFHLVLIFKDTERGYQLVREDVFKSSKLLFTKIRERERDNVSKAMYLVEKIKNKEQVSLAELEKLDELLLSFYKQKKKRFTHLSTGTIILLILATSSTSLISTLILPKIQGIKAATYGWVQTDWTGGVDQFATANHSDDQTNWTKIFSKDENVDIETAGELSISSTLVAITDTENEDFQSTTMTNNHGGFYIDAGTIKLKKQAGASCATDAECYNGDCTNGTCSRFLDGPCAIMVYERDMGTRQWKTSNTTCNSPQCSSGYLSVSSSVDFSEYPAAKACQEVGGFLPTQADLRCMTENPASYGNNFAAGSYWSRREDYASRAYYVTFPVYNTGSQYKTTWYNVRCIKSK